VDRPDATMTFRNIAVAQAVLSGKEDGLAAIGRGDVAVWGMLPKNRLSHATMKRLRLFAGPEHDHKAQQPKPIELMKNA